MEMNQKPTRTSLPPVDNTVGEAKEDKGAYRRCMIQQTESNRKYLNKHEEQKNTGKC